MSRRTSYKFRLYLAGNALNSEQAQANLAAICETHLTGRYEIELVDVFRDPKRALADNIFLTPTLVKLWPLPLRKIVGTLSQTQVALDALGLDGGNHEQ